MGYGVILYTACGIFYKKAQIHKEKGRRKTTLLTYQLFNLSILYFFQLCLENLYPKEPIYVSGQSVRRDFLFVSSRPCIWRTAAHRSLYPTCLPSSKKHFLPLSNKPNRVPFFILSIITCLISADSIEVKVPQ